MPQFDFQYDDATQSQITTIKKPKSLDKTLLFFSLMLYASKTHHKGITPRITSNHAIMLKYAFFLFLKRKLYNMEPQTSLTLDSALKANNTPNLTLHYRNKRENKLKNDS